MTMERILLLAHKGAYDNKERWAEANNAWKKDHGCDNHAFVQLINRSWAEMRTISNLLDALNEAD